MNIHEFLIEISLNENLQGISDVQSQLIRMRSTQEKEQIVGAYADIFKAEGAFLDDEGEGEPTDITTFDPLKEIDNFLTMMVDDGFIFSPLLIRKLCGNQDVLGAPNPSQFMDWIAELVGDTAHAWKDHPLVWVSPTDTTQKQLKHEQTTFTD